MSDISSRVYQIAKAYLEAAKGRLSEIDAAAQAELSRSLPRENGDYLPTFPTASSDPMERAAAKIAAARTQASSYQELSTATAPSQTVGIPPALDPIQTAYKVIGLPPGADYVTVEQAVNKLRERCAPSRFPDGSQEQAEAHQILERVEEAYKVLTDQRAIESPTGRFEKLEF